jgi:hypothetical protein
MTRFFKETFSAIFAQRPTRLFALVALVAPSAGCTAATPPPPPALIAPAATTTAAEAPLVAAGPGRCTVDRLSLEPTEGDQAMHHASARFLWKNVSSSPCEIEGFPSVRPLGADGRPLPKKLDVALAKEGTYLTSRMPVRRIVLSPGDAAWFAIDFGVRVAEDDACVTIAKVDVAPPGARRGKVVAADWEVCTRGLEVSPIAPGKPDG